MRRFLYAFVGLLGMCGVAAYGNYTATQGAGTTFVSYVVGGFHSAGVVLTGGASGTETGIAAAPLRVDPTGTTPQPVTLTSTTITGTVAATQSGTWNVAGTGASGAALSGNPFRVALSDGANSQNWLAALALADGVNGNNTGAVATWLWNGTTYDRQRGDLTNGAFVNVKALAPASGVSQAKTGAAASSLVAKASAGSVMSISGSAANGSYIMLFNATSAPADGAVTPDKCWGPMAAAGPFSLSWGIGPVFTASTGITVVSSSTGCFTKTATNAAFLAVEYQ